jgi:hypothetical protein
MAVKANLIIDQGSDYIQDIEVSDANNVIVDLSTYSGAAQIRKTYTSETFKAFTVATNANGIVQISINAANTNALAPGQYVWDCELTELNTGIVTRIVEGIVTITPSVTK